MGGMEGQNVGVSVGEEVRRTETRDFVKGGGGRRNSKWQRLFGVKGVRGTSRNQGF